MTGDLPTRDGISLGELEALVWRAAHQFHRAGFGSLSGVRFAPGPRASWVPMAAGILLVATMRTIALDMGSGAPSTSQVVLVAGLFSAVPLLFVLPSIVKPWWTRKSYGYLFAGWAAIVVAFDWLRFGFPDAAGLPYVLISPTIGVALALALSAMRRVNTRVLLTDSLIATLTGLPRTVGLAGRAIPVTLAILFVAFFTGDMWAVLVAMPLTRFVELLGLIGIVIALTAAGAAWDVVKEIIEESRADQAMAPDDEQLAAELQRAKAALPVSAEPPASLGVPSMVNLASVFAIVIAGRAVLLWIVGAAIFASVALIVVDDGVAHALVPSADPAHTEHAGIFEVSLLLGAVGALTFISSALSSRRQRRELVSDQLQRVGAQFVIWRDYVPVREAVIEAKVKSLIAEMDGMTMSKLDAVVQNFTRTFGRDHGAYAALEAERRRVAAAARGGSGTPIEQPDRLYRLTPLLCGLVLAAFVSVLMLAGVLEARTGGFIAAGFVVYGAWSTWHRWNSPPPSFGDF